MPGERSADGVVAAMSAVDRRTSERRWHALDYLHRCRYPATVEEVGDQVSPRLGEASDEVRTKLRSADLPALAAGDVLEYDVGSQLVCVVDTLDTLEACVSRAIEAGAIEWPHPNAGTVPE